MFSIRTTKTSSKATAVQVVRYDQRKTVVVKHIGSAHNDDELKLFKKAGRDWIKQVTKQIDLFPQEKLSESASKILVVNKSQYLGERYTFFLEVIRRLFHQFGFNRINDPLLLDLVVVRLLEPTSKLKSLDLLAKRFGLYYSRSYLYRRLPLWLDLKDKIEAKIILIAKKHFNFDFKLVFYDVTTLYFESFKDDSLRKCGFSKDSKFNQPQILIGLLVNRDGFPIGYEIFTGNTFEGHTLLPAILKLRKKHRIKNLTVVADAAMISLANINQLVDHQLNYIVGARLSNIQADQIKTISQKLNQNNGKTICLNTNYGRLICDFSKKRCHKDKSEMNKQLEKAMMAIRQPAKITKRYKFIKQSKKSRPELNQPLIDKAKLLLGIKGHYTNLERVSHQTIIRQYRNLWQVEKSFRIAKSDLEIRPVYHWKQKAVKTHILLCFMALSIAKYIEIKTGKSLQKVVEELKAVADARILNKLTGEEIVMRSNLTKEVKQVLSALNLSY